VVQFKTHNEKEKENQVNLGSEIREFFRFGYMICFCTHITKFNQKMSLYFSICLIIGFSFTNSYCFWCLLFNMLIWYIRRKGIVTLVPSHIHMQMNFLYLYIVKFMTSFGFYSSDYFWIVPFCNFKVIILTSFFKDVIFSHTWLSGADCVSAE